MIAALMGITLLGTIAAFLKDKKSLKMRYVMLPGYYVVAWIVAFAYSQDFAVIIPGFVLICGVSYFDMRFTLISGGLFLAVITSAVGLKISSGENIGEKGLVDFAFALSASAKAITSAFVASSALLSKYLLIATLLPFTSVIP